MRGLFKEALELLFVDCREFLQLHSVNAALACLYLGDVGLRPA
jgi:hypothetical protein